MKKIILTLAVLCSIVLMGCNESATTSIPPWSPSQIERMENEEVKCVPLLVFRF